MICSGTNRIHMDDYVQRTSYTGARRYSEEFHGENTYSSTYSQQTYAVCGDTNRYKYRTLIQGVAKAYGHWHSGPWSKQPWSEEKYSCGTSEP